MRRTLFDVVLALLSLVVGAFLGPAVEDWIGRIRAPETKLHRAIQAQEKMTPKSLNSAIVTYRGLLDDPRVGTEALRRISQSYSDLAFIYQQMGLAWVSTADEAVAYARAARLKENHRDSDLILAQAYIARNQGDDLMKAERALNRWNSRKGSSREGVHADYLKWRLGHEDLEGFPDLFEPDEQSRFQVVLSVAWVTISRARILVMQEHESQGEEYLSRATELLDWSEARLGEPHPFIYFCRGYMNLIRGQHPDARDSFERALDLAPIFPKAHINYGFSAAAEGDYETAAARFWHAYTQNPVSDQLPLLNNLAEAKLEIGKPKDSCIYWNEARQLDGGESNLKVRLGLALCRMAQGDRDIAEVLFREAVVLGEKEGTNLLDIETFGSWHAGPKELELANSLIQISKESPLSTTTALNLVE